MAHFLVIDDDPDLLPEKIAHLFPPQANQVEVAYTGEEGLRCLGASCQTLFSLTCVSQINRVLMCCGTFARLTRESLWSLSRRLVRPMLRSKRCDEVPMTTY